jgi:hypothetical protein
MRRGAGNAKQAREKAAALERGRRRAARAPTFRDVFQLPEGVFWLAGWILGERHGFLLRPLGELEASPRDTFLSFSAWRVEMRYDVVADEWRERITPEPAA